MKQTTNQVPPNIFTGFEVRKNVRSRFWKPNHSMKRKYYVFRDHKQGNKVGFVNLERKLWVDSYGWGIFKLKYQKTVERTYLETGKQEAR